MITPVVVPEGIDELRVRRQLIEDFGIEIGAAFGPAAGTDLAHRHHGLQRHASERPLVPGRARGGAARGKGGGPTPAPAWRRPLAHYRAAGTSADARADDSLGAAGIGRY